MSEESLQTTTETTETTVSEPSDSALFDTAVSEQSGNAPVEPKGVAKTKEQPSEPAEDKSSEAGEAEPPEETKEETPPEEKPAYQKMLEERAKLVEDYLEQQAKGVVTPPPQQQPQQPGQPTITDTTSPFTQLKIDELPTSIDFNGEKFNLKAQAEMYSELWPLVQFTAQAMAKKVLASQPKPETMPSEMFTQLQERMGIMQEQQDQLSFLLGIAEDPDIPNPRKIINDPDFQGWLKKQATGIQALAASRNPENGIAIIRMWQDQGNKKKVADIDKKAAEKKQKKDALFSGALQSKPTTTTGAGDEFKSDKELFEDAIATAQKQGWKGYR